MTLALVTAAVMIAALAAYALTGGADYGAGVLELFASGPRKSAQREVIEQAIAPIWEANHVWLILIVVLLFVGFPAAFAELSIKLHIPLTVMLVGLVLRGSGFVFRSYDPQPARGSERWGTIFAASSLLTPLALGVSLGAAISGRLSATTGFVSAWLAPFPLLVGGAVLSLFVLTAAVYLTHETSDAALQDDFRRRALVAALLSGGLAWAAIISGRSGAPHIYAVLIEARWAIGFQLLTATAAGALLASLWLRRYRAARWLVMLLNALVIAGLGRAQYPYILYPTHPIAQSAPASVLGPVLAVLGIGTLALVPSLYKLYALFKSQPASKHS